MENKDLFTFAAVFIFIGLFIGYLLASYVLSRRIRRAEINGWRSAIKHSRQNANLQEP